MTGVSSSVSEGLPLESLLKVVEKYKVSLDWLVRGTEVPAGSYESPRLKDPPATGYDPRNGPNPVAGTAENPDGLSELVNAEIRNSTLLNSHAASKGWVMANSVAKVAFLRIQRNEA